LRIVRGPKTVTEVVVASLRVLGVVTNAGRGGNGHGAAASNTTNVESENGSPSERHEHVLIPSIGSLHVVSDLTDARFQILQPNARLKPMDQTAQEAKPCSHVAAVPKNVFPVILL